MKVYVIEGQEAEMAQFINSYLGDSPNRVSNDNQLTKKGNDAIFAGTQQERYRAMNITAELKNFNPNVVMIPVKMSEDFEKANVQDWGRQLDNAGATKNRLLVGIASKDAKIKAETAEALLSYSNDMEIPSIVVRVENNREIQRVFDTARNLAMPNAQAQQAVAAAPPPIDALQRKVAPTQQPSKEKISDTPEAKGTLKKNLPPIARNWLTSRKSKKETGTVAEVKVEVSLTIYSEDRKMGTSPGQLNSKNIIKETIFPGIPETKDTVKATPNTGETDVKVKFNGDRSEIHVSASISKDPDKQQAAIEQVSSITQKLTNAVPGGAMVKVNNDTHNDAVRSNLESKGLKLEVASARLKY